MIIPNTPLHLLLVILLKLAVHPANATVSFSSPNAANASAPAPAVLTVPSMDPFETAQDAFSLTNLILAQLPVPKLDTECVIPQMNAGAIRPGNNSGLAVFTYWDAASKAGCRTVAQLTEAVRLYAVGLEPALELFILFMPPLPTNADGEADGVSGGPFTEPYLSHSVGILDGFPAVRTTMLSNSDAKVFFAQFGAVKAPVYVAAEHESGPWNDVFLHPGYITFTVIILVCNIATVVFGLYFLIRQHKRRSGTEYYSHWDLPTAIAAFGVLSALFLAITARMRQQTIAHVTLDQLANTLYGLGFYLLLLFWLRTLSIFMRSTSFRLARAVVILCLVVTVVNFALGMAWIHSWPAASLLVIRSVTRILTPAAQILACLTWAFYGTMFLLRRRTQDIPGPVAQCIGWISRILIVGFVTYFAFSITGIVGGQVDLVARVESVTAVYMLVAILDALRCMALVAITVIPVWETSELRERMGGIAPLLGGSRSTSRNGSVVQGIATGGALGGGYFARSSSSSIRGRAHRGMTDASDVIPPVPAMTHINASTSRLGINPQGNRSATALAVAEQRWRDADREADEDGYEEYAGELGMGMIGLGGVTSAAVGGGWGAAAVSVEAGDACGGADVVLSPMSNYNSQVATVMYSGTIGSAQSQSSNLSAGTGRTAPTPRANGMFSSWSAQTAAKNGSAGATRSQGSRT